jgi:F420-dependent oxidoreductase-like protein
MSIGVLLAAGVATNDTSNYVDTIVDKARALAGAGVNSAWFGQLVDYDSPALAGIVGREVPELQVGTSAIPIFGRHPLLVSSVAQTVQAATHGRYHLGLAMGVKSFIEDGLGIGYTRPLAQLREFLTVLRSQLHTGTTDFHGELITAVSPPVGPGKLPGAEPPVPILVAAMAPQALRVTGELADGTLPYLAGPKTLSNHIVPVITKAAERAGRPAPRIVALMPAVVTANVEKVREAAVEQLAFYEQVPSYQRVIALEGASRAGDLAVIGDEETVAAEVKRYFDAGATEVVVTTTDLGGEDDQSRTWNLLGEISRSLR